MCVRQTKSSEIVNFYPRNSVKIVSYLICRERIYTYMYPCVLVCTYWCVCIVTHQHIRIFTYKYAFMFLYIYAVITVWKYDLSCFSSKCVTSSQKNVLQNRSAFRGELVQIARCVYVSRNALWTRKLSSNNLAIIEQYLIP